MHLKTFLKSKIHRATVTQSDIDYEGSCTIDKELMDIVGVTEYEQIHIYNITNGNRFVTYAIEGRKGSGVIAINGAGARLAYVGDKIIICTYVSSEVKVSPIILLVDEHNRIPMFY